MAPLLGRSDAIYVSTINKSDKLTGNSCVPRVFRVNKPDGQDAAVVRPWLATRKETRWAVLAADIACGSRFRPQLYRGRQSEQQGNRRRDLRPVRLERLRALHPADQ